MIEVIDQTPWSSSPVLCWRCDLPMDEERICGGSGYTLLCATGPPREDNRITTPSAWTHAPGPRGTTACGRPARQDRIGQTGPVTCPYCNGSR